MKACKGLFMKDLYLFKNSFLVWIVIVAIAGIAATVIARYTSEPAAYVMLFPLFMMFHFAFIPVMMLEQLNREGKSQLWLYNPQRASMLVLSKLAAAIVYHFFTSILIAAYPAFVYLIYRSKGTMEPFKEVFSSSLWLSYGLTIFVLSIYAALWVIFFWCVYHYLAKFPAIKKARWLILILLFAALNYAETFTSRLLEQLSATDYKFNVYLNLIFSYDRGSGWEAAVQSTSVPYVAVALHILIGAALFYISCWLLDRKVEVQ